MSRPVQLIKRQKFQIRTCVTDLYDEGRSGVSISRAWNARILFGLSGRVGARFHRIQRQSRRHQVQSAYRRFRDGANCGAAVTRPEVPRTVHDLRRACRQWPARIVESAVLSVIEAPRCSRRQMTALASLVAAWLLEDDNSE